MEKTKSKSSQTVIGLIVGLVVMVLVQQILFKTPGIDKTLMKTANELNKTCPLMVDQVTQLDNAIALPDKIFQYNYTLVSFNKDSINIASFENYMRPMLLNNIKTLPELKPFRDNKVTMAYNYKDRNGIFITKISISYDDYSK